MGIVTGGITGNVSGQVAGVVFSEARGRTGKLNTVRQKVIPTNPQSSDQTIQRTKFSDSIAIVRALGPRAYRLDWDRAIGQLPGFQSWTSVLLNNMDEARLLTAPPSISLGLLPEFTNLAAATGAASGEVTLTWSATTQLPGTATDELNVAAIPAAAADRDPTPAVYFQNAATRADATATLTGLTAGDSYVLIVWGQNAADNIFSPTTSFTVSAASVRAGKKVA